MSAATRWPRAALCALCLLLYVGPASATTFIDPALRFQTFTTAHFIIYFHHGEENQARRLAAIAEDTWRALQRPLAVTPPPLTHVMLVDQDELANGWAIPVPYDTIFVTAAWPAGSDFIGLTDDWLRLVFTHEYTHIVHLDRSEGWARIVKRVFGRVPFAFPNLFLPTWQIEGLAVYEESAITGEGRLHAGDFLTIEQTARREHALDPIDRVNGGLVRWPGSSAAYAYGAPFHEYLADTYGQDTLALLADDTAHRLPYTSSLAFKRVYGKSLGELWRDFEALPPSGDRSDAVESSATRITHHGYSVSGPRFIPPACAGCPVQIAYSLSAADAFPSLNSVDIDGGHDRPLTTRYLGSTSGVHGNLVVFDQYEVQRNAALLSDLYTYDRRDGSVRRMTHGARLRDPDISPDGTRLVCAQEDNGRRDLVILTWTGDGETPAVVARISNPDTQFDAPRWSPDGRSIAAARHRLGGQSELVLVDAGTATVRVIASDAIARIVTPAWRPDGRAIVAATDAGGTVFNLYEFDIDGSGRSRRLTDEQGGATWPDVSPDGRTIVYVGYTTDGFDLFTVRYPDSPAPAREFGGVTSESASAAQPLYQGAAAPYSPWPTLEPTSWMPFVDSSADQLRVGAAVAGSDVLGYHAYSLSATWLVASPDGATPESRATPDWKVAYAYLRWRPTFFASAARTTSFFAGPATDAGAPTNITAHEYQFEAGVQLPFIHTRRSDLLFSSILRSADTYNLPGGDVAVRRTALRAGWEAITAHTYGYSISPEGGVSVGATIEAVRRALDSYGDATTATADARAYLPGFAPHHVVAVRIAAGASGGNDVMQRTFLSGGPGPADVPLSFDAHALGLLRGFPADTFAGSHIAVANADYRFPIVWPERGHGTLPLFLRSLHAAAFVDAADIWTHEFRAADLKTSEGLELSADVVAGYALPLTVAAGIGWGHDGAGRIQDARTFYVRVGRAF